MNRYHTIRVVHGLLSLVAALAVGVGPAAAHGPDPVVGGTLWGQDQTVTYQWHAGQVPPEWMASSINAAAGDASFSRGARAATLVKTAATSASLIAYGEPTGCSSAGIACFDRSGAPNSFRMWFRAHGYVFDWGTLRWCQGQSTFTNGCFDVETIALDEFGHVEGLGHHVNFGDGSDYLDAVVQTLSHARPSIGWQVDAFGPCDTARLQLLYDRLSSQDLFSTCLSVPTATTMSVPDTSIWLGDTMKFTATLRTTSTTANGALANDLVGGRTVTLQRRPLGTQSWTTIGSMTPGATEGTYVLWTSPTATYDWRAYFLPAAADGALASSSAPMRVTVGGCNVTGCPSRPVP
jgi:hypothetical protein